MAIEAGQSLLHYRIVGPLGSGGMGDVYRAEDTRLKREVALKVLPQELAADPERRARFEREAQAVAALNHPNIVTIHSVERAGDVHFITMELIDGRPLTRIIDDAGSSGVSLTDFFAIAVPLADALATAHDRGITHRDLKPDNVMRTRDGRIKVLDFGLAKIGGALSPAGDGRETAMATATVTEAGRIMGTVAYMSPEQAEGKPVDARSDVFSLGIVLYQMATGQPPFRGDTSISTITSILRDTPPSITERNAALPNHLGRIVARCLMKDPKRRYQTAKDLRNELEQLSAELGPGGSSPDVRAPAPKKRSASPVVVGLVVGALALVMLSILWLQVGTGRLPEEAGAARSVAASVAVLPFASVGQDEDSLAFTGGIHNDLLTRLSKIGALKVISRTSVMEYRGTTKNLRQIAEELGVGAVVEGTVQRAGNRLRLNAQLVNATNDESIWAETYDRELSAGNIFDIQADVAEQIASALQARLTPAEQQLVHSRPTDNLEAYRAYQAGVEYRDRSEDPSDQVVALQLLLQAVELDPGFALAHAKLSVQHAVMYWNFADRTEQRLELARAAFETAERLSPGLPEVHVARGYYRYWGFLDYDAALAEFAEAAKSQPNDTNVMAGIAYVMRRQGRMQEAQAMLKRMTELNPRDMIGFEALGTTQTFLRNYDDAEATLRRVLASVPTNANAVAGLATIAILADGDVARAREALRRGDELRLTSESYLRTALGIELIAGDDAAVGSRLDDVQGEIYLEGQDTFLPKSLVLAWVYDRAGEPDRARENYEVARAILEPRLGEEPQDPRFAAALGYVYAGLGRKQEAIAMGLRAVAGMPYEKDAIRGGRYDQDLAAIYARVGEPDLAIDRLEDLLSRPVMISPTSVRLDPVWSPLRDHPRFQRLVAP